MSNELLSDVIHIPQKHRCRSLPGQKPAMLNGADGEQGAGMLPLFSRASGGTRRCIQRQTSPARGARQACGTEPRPDCPMGPVFLPAAIVVAHLGYVRREVCSGGQVPGRTRLSRHPWGLSGSSTLGQGAQGGPATSHPTGTGDRPGQW